MDRVTVDAIVVDKDGTPIRDLTRDDFTLDVDGKPRRVQSAELVSFDRAPGASGGTGAAGAPVPEALPEITTNANAPSVPGRLVMLAFRPAMDLTATGRPPDLDEDRRIMAAGLANIASASGGALLQPAGKGDGAFQQIARELSARYTLSFDVEPGDQDGKPHRITLRMTRGSTRLLRYRREFTWRPPAAGPSTGDPQATLAGLLASGEIRNELPLQVSAFTMPQLKAPGQKTTLWAHLPESGAGASVRLEVFDEKNVRVVQTSTSIDTRDYAAAMSLPPGRDVARVAAQDSTGKLGSIEHAFEARVQGTADLRVGGLMLLDEQSVSDGHPAPLHNVDRETSAFRACIELRGIGRGMAGREGRPRCCRSGGWPRPHDRTAVAARDQRCDAADCRNGRPVRRLERWQLSHPRIAHQRRRRDRDVTRTLVLDTAHTSSAGTPTTTTGGAGTGAGAGAASVDEAVSLGSDYVQQYVTRGSSIVAEEHYVQIVRRGPPDAKRRNVDPDLEWREDNWTRGRSFQDAKLRRQLISDVLMVKASNGTWINFRDVGTVDGKEIADRSKRALDLFTKGGAIDVGATLRRIAEESSRRDLGRVGNINNPTLPLLVLQPAHKPRFDFRGEGTDTIDGVTTMVLSYRERRAPTFIRNRQNEDVFISGKLWIVPADGRVLRTELVSTTSSRERPRPWS